MDIASRIQEVIRKNQLNAARFADRIGVQRSNLSHVLTGRNKPGLDFIEKVLLEFPNIDANWLISGTKNASNRTVEAAKHDDSELIVNQSIAHSFDSSISDKPKNQPSLKEKEVKAEKIIVLYSDGTFEEFNK